SVVAFRAGITDRDQAQAWKGWTILVPRSAFPALAEGEFYWVDLLGCTVIGKNGQGEDVVLGTVSEVGDNGAHAVLHVARVEAGAPMLDAKGRQRESLIPFVGAHVHGVDLAAKRIDSDWPDDF